MTTKLISVERIEERIFFLRGHRIMLDSDLAELYGVSTKVLNQAVKRNNPVFRTISCFSYLSQKLKL